MPKELEKKLFKEAKAKFPKNIQRQNAYVYGTMNKIGLMHKKKKK